MTEAIEQIHATASLLVPEIILLATVCVLFLLGSLAVSHAGEAPTGFRHQAGLITLMALGVAWCVWFGGGKEPAHGALFAVDNLLWYTRGLTLSVGFLLALVLWSQIDDAHAAEAHACLLSILTGTSLTAAADDLVSLFLALELVSIPTYVILYLPRRERTAREAALKYFLLSVFSSALVLYGMSWLYGIVGTTNLTAIAEAIGHDSASGASRLVAIAMALLLAGLSFRITAVPFHFYAPDVFQGTTAANAALLSVVPKIVGFVALLRLVPLTVATDSAGHWTPNYATGLLLAILAVATMFVGNLMALRQTNLYRLMAYSSVAHAGYMLVGLAVGHRDLAVGGTEALLFYLAVYGLMTIGVFALVGAVGNFERPLRTVADLRGLSRSQPTIALLLAVCLLSLTGLPPTAGFLAKLNLFIASWSAGSDMGHALAMVMALNAAIAAWYYLRLIAVMFLDAPEGEPLPQRVAWSSWLAGVLCTAGVIILFFAPQWLWDSLP